MSVKSVDFWWKILCFGSLELGDEKTIFGAVYCLLWKSTGAKVKYGGSFFRAEVWIDTQPGARRTFSVFLSRALAADFGRKRFFTALRT